MSVVFQAKAYLCPFKIVMSLPLFCSESWDDMIIGRKVGSSKNISSIFLGDQEEVSVQDPKSYEFIEFSKEFFFKNSSLDGMKDFTPFIEKSIKIFF
ncbi:hypothetical protein Tco_1075207 [Tanacetum coccineum]